MAKKQVLRGNLKHDGEVFVAGTPATKLPAGVKQHVKDNDFLMDEDAFMVYAGLVEEDETGDEE